MVQISEVKGNSRENRTAAHTHIRGLGLRSDGTSEITGDGFVGQASAREVSEPISRLILDRKRS
jgi:RuvB-like protein 1 (pontin 52)